MKVGSRGGTFYCEDTETGVRTSLRTKDEEEAERLVHARNEAFRNPHMNRQMGMTYLSAADPLFCTRTWNDVMVDIVKDKHGPTLHRWNTAMKDEAFNLIRPKVVVSTTSDEFLAVLRLGTVSTNVYLRRLQNHCCDMGWLPTRILPKKKFPKIVHKEARAILWEEHLRIIEREKNPERRNFYELCWHFGASQSDLAQRLAEDINYGKRCFAYDRLKTKHLGGTQIGGKAWEVIMHRPRQGPLFPYLITVREADRATEFGQRCDGLGIEGITLHSYRYAWAERAADNGYPERYAQRALGHSSKIVHRAYAKKAQGEIRSLEVYEEARRKAVAEGKIVTLQPEAEVPKVA